MHFFARNNRIGSKYIRLDKNNKKLVEFWDKPLITFTTEKLKKYVNSFPSFIKLTKTLPNTYKWDKNWSIYLISIENDNCSVYFYIKVIFRSILTLFCHFNCCDRHFLRKNVIFKIWIKVNKKLPFGLKIGTLTKFHLKITSVSLVFV